MLLPEHQIEPLEIDNCEDGCKLTEVCTRKFLCFRCHINQGRLLQICSPPPEAFPRSTERPALCGRSQGSRVVLRHKHLRLSPGNAEGPYAASGGRGRGEDGGGAEPRLICKHWVLRPGGGAPILDAEPRAQLCVCVCVIHSFLRQLARLKVFVSE